MKCFILKKQDQYSFMFIKPEDLQAFYKQHGHQVVVEADDLQDALIQFGKLPR
ncbi:MAG: hypothetical protein AAFQ01_04970 [Bacteroidota bacterium]